MRSGGVVSSTVIVNDSGSDSTPLASVAGTCDSRCS